MKKSFDGWLVRALRAASYALCAVAVVAVAFAAFGAEGPAAERGKTLAWFGRETCGRVPVDPCSLEFRRVATRRFILDNELPLASYEPTRVVADVQHPAAAFDTNLVLVAGWCPCAHYSVDVAAGAARVVFALPDGSAKCGFRATPGGKVEADGVALRPGEAAVPSAPFRFSALAVGNGFSLLATKDGRTVWLGSASWRGTPDLRAQSSFGAVKFFVDVRAGEVTHAASALSAGFGQADTRFVTTGRDKRLYFENGRAFFTFSARGVGAMGVASFDPSRFDVRLEGSILFDAGDGLFRGDGPADLFYDEDAREWRAWVCNFSTVNSKDGTLSGREEGGVNYAWSKRSPLHGLSVMQERNMGLPGMNEDPTGVFDASAGKWRMFLSEFTDRGIRGSIWESANWNGPYGRLTPPTKEDSTGQCLVALGGTRWALAGSADRACHVYTYPDLTLHGDVRFDVPPWNERCPNGRVWASLGVLPEGFPYRYVFLTMDRANFPGVPNPNWTYGALHFYAGSLPRAATTGDGRLPEKTHVVADQRGYNSWPMIQAMGESLVCSYSRDNALPADGHTIDPGSRDSYARFSSDGGVTWSAERTVADDPAVGEVNEGIGLDSTGAALLWVRCIGAKNRHELHRTADGVTFRKIASVVPDPFPMQVMDVVRVEGLGLVSLWFAGDYGSDRGHSWGMLVSADDGRTWSHRVIEKDLSRAEWVTEPSLVDLGKGRLLVVGRTETTSGRQAQFQVTSIDGGKTWKKSRTNITDVRQSTPSLIHDRGTGLISNYYYERGARLLKRRVVRADFIFDHPDAWPEPEVLDRGFEQRYWDAGNVKATRLGNVDCCAWYTGTQSNAAVVVTRVPAAPQARGE